MAARSRPRPGHDQRRPARAASGPSQGARPPKGRDGSRREDARAPAREPAREQTRQTHATSRGASPRLTETAARAVVRGHPWVYQGGIASSLAGMSAGDLVVLAGPDGAPLARAFVDPESALVARVLDRDPGTTFDARLVRARLDAAFARRRALVASDATTAYRLLNGEGDRLPGWVIDRYADVAVVRTDGEGAARLCELHRETIAAALADVGVTSVALRVAASEGEGKIVRFAGQDPPDSVHVREHGMTMIVDLARGQKTGAFLDQRENRRRVRALAAGRRVLNLFSYAGGFSLAAALGGARHVTSVDIAKNGHVAGQRSFAENGVSPEAHAWITSDAFVFLEKARARGDVWDLVICDPPSFAPNERAKLRALSAYRKLHAACARVLAKEGILCAASCSSHVDAEELLTTLDGASVGRDLSLVAMYGQPEDHPTLPAWPEGRYLKLAVLAGGGA